MSLLVEAIDTFSQTSSDALADRVIELPVYLLDRSLKLNPLLESRQDAILDLRRHIEQHNVAAALWRDPEIYYPIFSLSDLARDLDRVDQLLDVLRVHLGLSSVGAAGLPDGFYRLAHQDGTLVYRQGDSVRPVDAAWRLPEEEGRPRVYLGLTGLFSDILAGIVPPDVYMGSSVEADLLAAAQHYQQAYALMATYDHQLAIDFCRIVNTVVLLPPVADPLDPDNPAMRWSFNLRFRYYGGVFVNPHLVDPFGLAEGLIHEYIHQRTWLWWMLDPPTGIPPVGSKVRSPVTGAVKDGTVMFQALLVYVNALDFYRRIEEQQDSVLAFSDWAKGRKAKLESALPALAENVLNVIPRDSTLGQLVNWSMARVSLPRAATS